jgi:hypothetical protein
VGKREWENGKREWENVSRQDPDEGKTCRINKNAKILLPSLNREPRTKPNIPCDGTGPEKYRTPLPYRSVFGCAPPPTKLSVIGSLQPSNFGTLGVHPLHTPVLGS